METAPNREEDSGPKAIVAAPEVSIIIVNWKSREYLRKCLQSIYKFTRGLAFEIVVIDNASHDGCGEILAQEFPAAIFIQSPENLGFGRANNLAAESAIGRHLLFLNPDTELQNDAVQVLFDSLVSVPGAGAAGARLFNTDGSLQMSSVLGYPTIINEAIDLEILHRLFPRWGGWGTRALYSPDNRAVAAQAVSGACILVKKNVFRQVAGFSEFYFMYAEDIDLCWKINRCGHGVYHVPAARLTHFGGGSTRSCRSHFADVAMRESIYRFFLYQRGKSAAFIYRLTIACAAFARMLVVLPLLPVSIIRSDRDFVVIFKKWRAILFWAVGLNSKTVAAAGRSPAQAKASGSPLPIVR